VDDLTLSPDQKSIQKQSMAAAKTDPNVDYAINPPPSRPNSTTSSPNASDDSQRPRRFT